MKKQDAANEPIELPQDTQEDNLQKIEDQNASKEKHMAKRKEQYLGDFDIEKNRSEITEMELKNMKDPYEKFEKHFAFYRMDVNGFMKLVNDARRIVEPDMGVPLYMIKYVTLESLQEAFKENEMWSSKLKNEQSNLIRLLNATCIYKSCEDDVSQQENEKGICYDIRNLRGWAVLWCDGDVKEKVVELYDMLQDNDQPKITATDKDFNVTMTLLFDMAGYTIDRNYNIISDEEMKPDLTEDEMTAKEEKYEEIFEQFLDQVFGEYESSLSREDWQKNVCDKAKYVFNPAEIRKMIQWK